MQQFNPLKNPNPKPAARRKQTFLSTTRGISFNLLCPPFPSAVQPGPSMSLEQIVSCMLSQVETLQLVEALLLMEEQSSVIWSRSKHSL